MPTINQSTIFSERIRDEICDLMSAMISKPLILTPEPKNQDLGARCTPADLVAEIARLHEELSTKNETIERLTDQYGMAVLHREALCEQVNRFQSNQKLNAAVVDALTRKIEEQRQELCEERKARAAVILAAEAGKKECRERSMERKEQLWALMNRLYETEKELGKVRKERWERESGVKPTKENEGEDEDQEKGSRDGSLGDADNASDVDSDPSIINVESDPDGDLLGTGSGWERDDETSDYEVEGLGQGSWQL
jgi:hypothetical protein